MRRFNCHHLNTWPIGLDMRVKAHIVNRFNSAKTKVFHIEAKDVRFPSNRSIPILIKRRRGKNVTAIARFKNKKWFITMEVGD